MKTKINKIIGKLKKHFIINIIIVIISITSILTISIKNIPLIKTSLFEHFSSINIKVIDNNLYIHNKSENKKFTIYNVSAKITEKRNYWKFFILASIIQSSTNNINKHSKNIKINLDPYLLEPKSTLIIKLDVNDTLIKNTNKYLFNILYKDITTKYFKKIKLKCKNLKQCNNF